VATVPRFVPRINPQFSEVVFFLTTQMMDEARHIEAFTKRALANGGGLQYSAASTQLSLKSLFDQHDFAIASFLLSVLGEGTFLDLLQFIEVHAPDPVTAVCRRARADEARHVHFGMAHMRYYLAQDPDHYDILLAAVASQETRAWQDDGRVGVAAAELHRARVTGRGVTVSVQSRDYKLTRDPGEHPAGFLKC
jgi:hypothetical protein